MTTTFLARMSIGLAGVLLASGSWAQETPPATGPRQEAAKAVPTEESPQRQPPQSTSEADGKSVTPTGEKRVLADPATKRYMPCRDPNESRSAEEAPGAIKPNPKASVLSEEAAKQHGYKPSPHKVDCPKP